MLFSISHVDYISVLDKMLSFKPRFMTSAKVVMKASSLRIEAIRAIARERGVEIEDERSRCIDENLLSLLADAHVRRMKFYFNNSKRHIAELSGAELAIYVDFCKTFKKHQTDSSIALVWDEIDTDALREQFNRKVHSLTPSPSKKLFGDTIAIDDRAIINTLCPKHDDTYWHEDFASKDNLVSKVLQSYWCYAKPAKEHFDDIDNRLTARRVTLSARYHIYSADDEDDILFDARINKLIINRALKNVA